MIAAASLTPLRPIDAAVASLLENYSRDELERRLKIVNLPTAAKELLDHSLDNADRSYHDPNFREALDRFWGISPPRPDAAKLRGAFTGH